MININTGGTNRGKQFTALTEIDRQQVIKLQEALNKIKVSTLYLQLLQEHLEAQNCLTRLLQLDKQDKFNQKGLSNWYQLISQKIIKLQLQLTLLKT